MRTRDLALIGAGYWGKNLARNFLNLGALHTLCDSNPETLAAYGKEYADVRQEQSFDHVLTNPEVSRVAIAAPAVHHFNLASAALEAGKDVYVEKPLCLNPDDAKALIEIAKKKRACVDGWPFAAVPRLC